MVHNGILLSHKNEWNNAICGNMGGPGNHTKWSKLERERQISCTFIILCVSKDHTNEPIYGTETESQT